MNRETLDERMLPLKKVKLTCRRPNAFPPEPEKTIGTITVALPTPALPVQAQKLSAYASGSIPQQMEVLVATSVSTNIPQKTDSQLPPAPKKEAPSFQSRRPGTFSKIFALLHNRIPKEEVHFLLPKNARREAPAVELSLPIKASAQTASCDFVEPPVINEPLSIPSLPSANLLPAEQQHKNINNDFCDTCGDIGLFLCCDNCPRSFHFSCVEPPIDPENIPNSEWFCNACRWNRKKKRFIFQEESRAKHSGSARLPLKNIHRLRIFNPVVFQLPSWMLDPAHVSSLDANRLERPKNFPFCHACGRSDFSASLLPCAFCPLSWHLDCADPPVTSSKLNSQWMCPLHVENYIEPFSQGPLYSDEPIESLEDQVRAQFQHRLNRPYIPLQHFVNVCNQLNRRRAPLTYRNFSCQTATAEDP